MIRSWTDKNGEISRMVLCTSINPQAAHDVFFAEEKHNSDRDEGDEAGGHQQVRPGTRLRLKHANSQRDGIGLKIGQVDQRIEKILPVIDKAKQQGGDGRRSGDRQHDMPIGLPGRCTVKTGCFFKMEWDGAKKLPEEEDVERSTTKPGGYDQGFVGVHPAEQIE